MISGRCAACKYLRRKCSSNCIFSPYFPSNDPQRFAFVHKIYGASNVGKMLQQIPANFRGRAVESIYFEARCRIEDPVYGCVQMISQLQEEIHKAESELSKVRAEIAFLNNSNTVQETQVNDQQAIEVASNRSCFFMGQNNINQQFQFGSSSQGHGLF